LWLHANWRHSTTTWRKNQKKNQLSIEEKNKKKIAAVYATREHGNQLFAKGDYETAFKVYERGVLIINGMYSTSDDDYTKMEEMEAILDLNMAMAKLKLKEYTEAIDHCKMSLQIDKSNPKAYYRMAEAYIGLGEYQDAKNQNETAIKINNERFKNDENERLKTKN